VLDLVDLECRTGIKVFELGLIDGYLISDDCQPEKASALDIDMIYFF
jgi:hypothetical protein